MAGPTIARAEVQVDVDGSAIPNQTKRLAKMAAAQLGKNLNKEMKPALKRVAAQTEPTLRSAFADVFRAVGADSASAFRAGWRRSGGREVAQVVQQQLGYVEAAVRDFGRRIRTTSANLWRPVADGGREAWGNLGDEVAKQSTRIRVETRGLANSIANTFVNMRETLAPGLWDRWGETARYHLNNVRAQVLRVRTDVESFATRARTAVDSVAESFANLGRRIASSRTGQSLSNLGRVLASRFRRAGRDAGDAFTEGMENSIERGLRGTARTVDRELGRAVRNTDREFRGLFGRLRGARNDFVNLVGIVGGALENLTVKGLDKVLSGVGGGIAKIGEAITGLGSSGGIFDKLGGAVQGFGTSIANLSSASGPIISTVIAIGVFANTLFLLIPILGVVAAAISAVTAAFTALVGVLGSAALGALVSLGPILLAVGVGAGAALLGILGLSDEMKKGFAPLQDWYEETKKIVSERLFANLGDQSERLANLLRTGLNPMLEASADKLAEFAEELLSAFESDKMQKVLAPLNVELPAILDNLLTLVRELALAFSGFFAAISPVVEEVTGKIADAADRFEDWVNSAEGQNKIKDWFDKAAEAADALWDIIENVGDALGGIFEAGNDTGQTFLDKLVDITDKFAEWVDSPEGREQLSSWFVEAENLAHKVWDILVALKDTFDKLNTPENRQLFYQILDGVEALIRGIGWLADQWDNLWNTFSSTYSTLKNTDWGALAGDIVQGFLDGLQQKWDEITTWWEDKWNAFVNWFKDFFGISSPSTLMAGFGEDVIDGFLQGIEQAWVNVVTWFANLPTTIKNTFATAGSWLVTQGGNLITGLRTGLEQKWVNVVTWFQSLPTRIRNFFSTAGSWLITQGGNIINGLRIGLEQRWVNIVLWFTSLPTRIRQFFANAGSWLITQGGNVINGFRQGLVDKWNTVVFLFRNLPAAIRLAVGDLGRTLYQAGIDVIQGFINGVNDKAATARNTISNVANSLAASAKSALGISSPSKVFAQIGEQVVDGLVMGINDNAALATSAMSNLSTSMADAWGAPNPMKATAGDGGAVAVAGGGGRTVIVQSGAIQYTTPLADPRLVAIQSLDELVVRLG